MYVAVLFGMEEVQGFKWRMIDVFWHIIQGASCSVIYYVKKIRNSDILPGL